MIHEWLSSVVCVLAFVSLLCVSPAAAQYTGKIVESVDIQGNRRLTDEELLKFVKTRTGNKFDEARVQQDLQSLLQTGQFNSTATRVIVEAGARGGVFVIFEVTEMPVVAEVHFTGLRYASEEEILGQLRERKAVIEISEPYNPNKVRKIVGIIREYLAKRGYPDAALFVSEEEVSATTLILTFRIDELPDVDEDDCGDCPGT